MQFEFDPKKSAANKAKHGMDFEHVQTLWTGRTVVFALVSAGEPRFMTLGKIDGKIWAAVWTPRDESLRIISARLASGKERKLYD